MPRSSFLAFAGLMVILAPVAHSQDASVSAADAQANLSRMLAADMYQLVRAKLANSGLAPQDVDRAAQIWTDGVASCAVDALVSDSDPRAMQILKALSNSETEVELNERLTTKDSEDDVSFLESLKPKLEECFSFVVQDAGIVR